MRVEPKFKPGDYIINRTSGDMGIIDKITPKNYYRFKAFWGHIFKEVKEKNYELQVNYQKFYDLCNENEKKRLDEIIQNKG